MAQVSVSPGRPLLSVGTVRDWCYGHAEGTAGEDDAGAGRAATVTSSTEGRGPSVFGNRLPRWQAPRPGRVAVERFTLRVLLPAGARQDGRLERLGIHRCAK
jgi:hypothetical protein